MHHAVVCRSLLTLATVCVLGSSAGVAFAGEPCTRVKLTALGVLSPAWHKAAQALYTELGALSDLECVDVQLVLTAEGNKGRLEITAADGRFARRVVGTPSELRAVAYGVLASIPPDATKLAPEPSETSETPPARPESSSRDLSIDRAPVPPAAERPLDQPMRPLPTAASLGLTFGTRVGLPTGVLAPELELRGDAHMERWVISVSARAAPTGARLKGNDDTSAEQSEFSFGLLGGRWFRLGGGVLTTTVGPRAGFLTESTDVVSKTHRDLWVQAALRYVAPIGERWRPAIGIDFDAAPMRLASADASTSMAFPSWSMAVRFGVVGGVR
jgi:hypothetical protein